MTRVATLGLFDRTLGHVLGTQSRVQDGQLRIASGKAAPTHAGLAPDVGPLVSLRSSHARAGHYLDGIATVTLRLQLMEEDVAQVVDVAARIRTLLIGALNADSALDMALDLEAEGALAEVASALNRELNGRYLFSGTRTDRAPVDLGQADYYQGDDGRLSVRADEGLEVAYGVTAGEDGFAQLIRAARLMGGAVAGGTVDRAALEEALEAVNEALGSLPEIRSRIGASLRTLDAVRDRHESFRLYAEGAIGDIEDVDIAAAIARLSQDQVQLEASYLTLSRLSALTLLDYLR